MTPRKGGRQHVGLPIYNTVKEAVQHVQPYASHAYVNSKLAANAILESIEATLSL